MSVRRTDFLLRWLIGAVLCFCAPVLAPAALAPGPDAYGYTVSPTTAFAFTNISTGGTKVLNFDDDASVILNLGFSFSFYGANYTNIAVNPNGLMSFAGPNTDYVNVNLNTSAPSNNRPIIAVLWCDYETESVGADALYYKVIGASGSRQFIMQWNQVMLVAGEGVDTITFQARLFEGSNRILFSYLDVVVADDPEYSNGAYATVGIRDVDGQLNGRNLLWSHKQAAVTNGMHLLFVPTNRPPVAVNDSAATAKNAPVTVSPLVNDSDPDGDALTIVGVNPTNGTASIAGTNVVFSPTTNFFGSASVGYTISDSTTTATALITIYVTNRPPVAVNDSAAAAKNMPVTVSPLVNDSDPDGDALTIVGLSPTNGTASIVGTNVVFNPATNFFGSASVGYTISDGPTTAAALITVNVTNRPPVAANDTASTLEDTQVGINPLVNDTDPDSDPLTITGATATNGTVSIVVGTNLIFTPSTNFNGTASIRYTISDGNGGTASAFVTTTVTAVNDAPGFTMGFNQSVLANAGPQTVANWATAISAGPPDESGQLLDFIVTNSHNALFSVQPLVSAAGTLTYTPATHSNGTATVSVTLHDNGGTNSGGVDTSAEQIFTISVLAPGQLVVSTTNSDFGVVSTGASSERTFVVTNLGEVMVTNGVASAASPFSVVSGSPFTIAGGGMTNVVVRFSPNSEGSFSNNVVFSSGSGGSVTNPVTGKGAVVPVAGFTAATTSGLAPLTVSFTDTSSGTITNRYWAFGDGDTLDTNGTAVTHLYDAVSTNTVSLTVSGPVGTDTLTRTAYIAVTNPPAAVADFVAGPTSGPPPLTVSFTNLSRWTTNYLWDFGDGNISTVEHPSNTYSNAGSYAVSLTALGPSGTDSLIHANCVIVTNSSPLIVQQPQDRTVTAGGDVAVAVVAIGTPPLAYRWFFSSASVPDAVERSLTIANFQSSNEGSYLVVVTNELGSVTSETAVLYLDWPVRFVNTFANCTGLFQTRLVGPAGSSRIIQVSTNRFLWTPLATNDASNGIFDFTDTNGISLEKRESRFYRALLAP